MTSKAERQEIDSGTVEDGRVDPQYQRHRYERQRNEIAAIVDAGRLDRAADLAHEHLVEFPDDRATIDCVVAALRSAPSPRVRARAGEFSFDGTEPPVAG